MTEQYLLFFGDRYYPQGGVHDFIGMAASLEEATMIIEGKTPADGLMRQDWWGQIAIVSGEKLVIVARWMPNCLVYKRDDGSKHYNEDKDISAIDDHVEWEARDAHTFAARADMWLIDGAYQLAVGWDD